MRELEIALVDPQLEAVTRAELEALFIIARVSVQGRLGYWQEDKDGQDAQTAQLYVRANLEWVLHLFDVSPGRLQALRAEIAHRSEERGLDDTPGLRLARLHERAAKALLDQIQRDIQKLIEGQV